jgi:hypothetical protein
VDQGRALCLATKNYNGAHQAIILTNLAFILYFTKFENLGVLNLSEPTGLFNGFLNDFSHNLITLIEL